MANEALGSKSSANFSLTSYIIKVYREDLVVHDIKVVEGHDSEATLQCKHRWRHICRANIMESIVSLRSVSVESTFLRHLVLLQRV